MITTTLFMNTLKLSALAVLAVLVLSCTTTTEPVKPITIDKTLVSTVTASNYAVELYADGAITVGYTPLYVRIRHNGLTLTDVHVLITPNMDMGSIHHTCPVEQDEEVAPDKDGLYHSAAIFTMASDVGWKVGITIHDHDIDTTFTVHIPIAVGNSGNTVTLKDASSTKYILTLKNAAWTVGMNDIMFNLYRTADGFDYTPVDDAEVSFAPTMPSMGHGSKGNVTPVATVGGWYVGRVNYTMTGDWQIALAVKTLDGQILTNNYQVVVR
ncbi:MAG: FixH family protein [Candidatus Kapabacteria bacterium]|nr:FixH family protein [Candidatus Kapabacteria bacterium]